MTTIAGGEATTMTAGLPVAVKVATALATRRL